LNRAAPPAAPAWAVPGFLENRAGRLWMAGQDMARLAEERGTPLYVYSAARIAERAAGLKAALDAIDPRTRICFAAKALSAIKVLRLIREAGLSVEVNSGGELYRAKLAGFPAETIVFNGVAKSEAELAEALDPPIKAINIDSLYELKRLAAVARRLERRAKLALRIVPEVRSATSPGNQTGSAETKFGILPGEVDAALAFLKTNDDCLEPVGLHVHVGSQITDSAPYLAAAAAITRHFVHAEAVLGRRLEHVNLGGGFPLPYMHGATATPQGGLFAPSIGAAEIARLLLPALRRGLRPEVEVILEPGRAMVGDCALLLARVENVKQRADGPWLYLDAGYNVLVESYTYKWYYHALSPAKLDEAEAEFRLVGPLCDNGDAFFDVEGEHLYARLAGDPRLAQARDLLAEALVRLPPRRRLAASTGPGDLVAFLDAGAYTLDQMTPNNGRPRPEAGLIDRAGSYEILRRRDSYADLLFNEAV
jgi:diaminopimelate decarboxylase